MTNATKNEAVWYFGTPDQPYSYADPVFGAENVVIIGGKFDSDSPNTGVDGAQILLGEVILERTSAEAPVLTLSLGKEEGGYSNFVALDGTVLDTTVNIQSVSMGEGDFDGDGILDSEDPYPTIPNNSIPTVSEWGMIIFFILLLGSALWIMMQRKRQE